MTKPLSSDLRARQIEAVAAGMSRRAAADRLGDCGVHAVKWVRRWLDTGSTAPRPQGGDKRSDRIEAHTEELLGLVAARHDITCRRLPVIWSGSAASGSRKARFGGSRSP